MQRESSLEKWQAARSTVGERQGQEQETTHKPSLQHARPEGLDGDSVPQTFQPPH